MIPKTTLKPGLQVDEKDLSDAHKRMLEWTGKGIDLRTHVVDPSSGTLLLYQPYRRTCDKDGVTYYRPDANGVERRYSEQGIALDPVVVEKAPETKTEKTPIEKKAPNAKFPA